MKFYSSIIVLAIVGMFLYVPQASADYADWNHVGTMTIDTTADGADLPAAATVRNFPVLVRLEQGNFNFDEAKQDGSDIRFTSSKGEPLSYQIETWNKQWGKAAVWVKVPEIKGNTKQDINIYWGNSQAAVESNGKAVFDVNDGFTGVWHLNENAGNTVDGFKDSTSNEAHGTSRSMDNASHVQGVAGMGKMLVAEKMQSIAIKNEQLFDFTDTLTISTWFKVDEFTTSWQGLFCKGDKNYRLTRGRGINTMGLFGSVGIETKQDIKDNRWHHLAAVYSKDRITLYLDGEASVSTNCRPQVPNDAPVWIGGNSNFSMRDWNGLIDEARLSKASRSKEWIKLCFENQKEKHCLVGPVKEEGRINQFGVVNKSVIGMENDFLIVRGTAVGADDYYWVDVTEDGKEVFVDKGLNVVRPIHRMVNTSTMQWKLKARYGTEWKESEVTITLQDVIPDPQFKMVSSHDVEEKWDGNTSFHVKPQIANESDILAAAAPNNVIKYDWSFTGVPVYKEFSESGVTIKHAYKNGLFDANLKLSNNGIVVNKNLANPIDIQLQSTPAIVPGKGAKGKLKVFVLIGQSNMEGYGRVDGEDTKGSLPWLLKNPTYAKNYQHLVDDDNKPLVHKDVWVYYPRESYTYEPKDILSGDLFPRFGQGSGKVEEGSRHIGPEYGIGLQMDELYGEQVLLIKTCWGGHSLGAKFRPPGVDNNPGPSYKRMLEIVKEVTGNIKTYFPGYQDQGYEIAGMFWHQGYNDQFVDSFKQNYEGNLAILIDDLRREWNVPDLPVVIGESGMMKDEIPNAQKAVGQIARFKGNVAFVPSRQYFQESMGPGAGYHWHYSFYSYYNLGNDMGKAMRKLMGDTVKD